MVKLIDLPILKINFKAKPYNIQSLIKNHYQKSTRDGFPPIGILCSKRRMFVENIYNNVFFIFFISTYWAEVTGQHTQTYTVTYNRYQNH